MRAGCSEKVGLKPLSKRELKAIQSWWRAFTVVMLGFTLLLLPENVPGWLRGVEVVPYVGVLCSLLVAVGVLSMRVFATTRDRKRMVWLAVARVEAPAVAAYVDEVMAQERGITLYEVVELQEHFGAQVNDRMRRRLQSVLNQQRGRTDQGR